MNNFNIRAWETPHIIPQNYSHQCYHELYVNKLFQPCSLKLLQVLWTTITSNCELLSILLSSSTKAYSLCSMVNTHGFEIYLQSIASIIYLLNLYYVHQGLKSAHEYSFKVHVSEGKVWTFSKVKSPVIWSCFELFYVYLELPNW